MRLPSGGLSMGCGARSCRGRSLFSFAQRCGQLRRALPNERSVDVSAEAIGVHATRSPAWTTGCDLGTGSSPNGRGVGGREPTSLTPQGCRPGLLDDLETGKRDNYRESTYAAVEAALGWEPGSCLRIVRGGRPWRALDPALVQLLDVWPRLSQDARAMLAELAQRALGS